MDISIHALRGESDLSRRKGVVFMDISIHALRGESDKGTKTRLTISHDFNPRSPRGERQQTYPKCCVAVWIDFLIFEKDAYKIKTKIITKWDF